MMKFRSLIKILYSPKYLHVTNVCTGATLTVLGYSLAAMLTFLGLSTGLYQSLVYSAIDTVKHKRMILVKLCMDQLFVATPTVAFYLFANQAYDSNGHWQSAFEYLKFSFLPVYLVDAVYWLPMQYVNFRFVPAKFRYVYVASAAVVWYAILGGLHLILRDSLPHQFSNLASVDDCSV